MTFHFSKYEFSGSAVLFIAQSMDGIVIRSLFFNSILIL